MNELTFTQSGDSWEDVIGRERERSMLDLAFSVYLDDTESDLWQGDTWHAMECLYSRLASDWHEEHFADYGFTLDDLTSLDARLHKLTEEQARAMLDSYKQA